LTWRFFLWVLELKCETVYPFDLQFDRLSNAKINPKMAKIGKVLMQPTDRQKYVALCKYYKNTGVVLDPDFETDYWVDAFSRVCDKVIKVNIIQSKMVVVGCDWGPVGDILLVTDGRCTKYAEILKYKGSNVVLRLRDRRSLVR